MLNLPLASLYVFLAKYSIVKGLGELEKFYWVTVDMSGLVLLLISSTGSIVFYVVIDKSLFSNLESLPTRFELIS